MKLFTYCLSFIIISKISFLHAQVTSVESQQASIVIAKWISRATGQYDIYSATSIGPKRGGDRFMIAGSLTTQTASEYGISNMTVKRDSDVTRAYEVLGFDTVNLADSVNLQRLHLNWSFANRHDFSFSYLFSPENINGWGLGYKRVLFNYRSFYFSYRVQYAQSHLDHYFNNTSFTNDFSASLYFSLFDLYAGIRHTSGKVSFYSSIPQLQLPTVNFISKLSEIDFFYGLMVATSLNTRFTFQVNQIGQELSLTGKFSFHFDSLFPTINNWFKDPRYIKN